MSDLENVNELFVLVGLGLGKVPVDKQGLEQVEDRDRDVGIGLAGLAGWARWAFVHADWDIIPPVEFFNNSDLNSSPVDVTDVIIVLPTINFSSLYEILSISSMRKNLKVNYFQSV